MEIYLLRTLNKRKDYLKSVELVKKIVTVAQPSIERWKEVKDKVTTEHFFCMCLDWNKKLSTVLFSSGVKLLMQDNVTRSIEVIEQIDDLVVSNLAVYKDLIFVFYREGNLKVYRGLGFKHVWTGPMIATFFGNRSWSMHGGFVQITKAKLFMIQEEGRRIAEFDLRRLAEAIKTNKVVEFNVKYIGQEVQAFAVSQEGKEIFMYVDRDKMLFLNNKEVRKINDACQVTNCMTAVGSMFMIGSYAGGSNIFELVDKRGSSLHSIKMDFSTACNDVKDLKYVKLSGAHMVVALRIYRYLDLFLIHSRKIHILRDSISTRGIEKPEIAVNHSLTVSITTHASFDMIVTQNDRIIASIAVNI